jgi:serine/threonine protein kinase
MKIRYKLQELINDDHHASLWLSKLHLDEEINDHLVVVKSLKIKPSQFKNAAQFFQERANAFLHLKHPSLAPLYDFGLMQGCFYVTQEYVEGFSLQQLLDALSSKRIHLPLWFILPIIYSIIQGVKAIHNNNKVLNPQRIEPLLRLTPSKIIITSKGLVKMIEPGIFTPFLNDTDNSRKKNYQAPEISVQPVPDQRSDIYSLGAIFFECVTGASPTKDSNLQEIASEHSWIPAEILTVFERSLDHNPDKRFLNLDELGFAIGNFIKYFDQKITHIELVNLLSILFPDSIHLSSSKKQIDTWFKTTEKKDPEKYAWITAFSQMYRNINSSSRTTFVNPMQHFYLAPLESHLKKIRSRFLVCPKEPRFNH